jgi:hypothetical protein
VKDCPILPERRAERALILRLVVDRAQEIAVPRTDVEHGFTRERCRQFQASKAFGAVVGAASDDAVTPIERVLPAKGGRSLFE